MRFTTLGDLFFHPSFVCVFLTILIVIGNIMVGVSILPRDKRQKGYRLHRYAHYAATIAYSLFLIANHFLLENTALNYAVLFYLLAIVPWTRGVNITLHAIMASVGLVLLVLVASLSVL